MNIADTLGLDAVQILFTSISNLSTFVGKLSSEIEDEALFARFKLACKRFLHAVSSEKHPIVVFLDDVQ
jgi:predicted ATPase